MKKTRLKNIEKNDISTIETVNLGGIPQKISIEGRYKNLPILVYFHGGPGFPFPYSVGSRGVEEEITQNFILVCWDQLGCGINNYSITNDFCITDFVDMGIALLAFLKEKFPNNSIHILSMSWGSILSAKLVAARSDLVDSVVAYGQFVKESAFSNEVYQALITSKLSQRNKKKLENIFEKKEFTLKNYKKILVWLRKHTNAFQYKQGNSLSIFSLILKFWSSPDYNLHDFIHLFFNGYQKNKSLLIEMIETDLTTTFQQINTPYSVIQGEFDINTSTKTAVETIHTIKNELINLKIVKESSHMPSLEAMQEVLKHLKETAL